MTDEVVAINPKVIPDGWLYLSANSLLSKWGFSDGDAIGDWWWDQHDRPLEGDADRALRHLVRSHLVPAIVEAGHTIEVCDIESSHNPIRAEKLDGRDVDDYANSDELSDIGVAIPPAIVHAALAPEEGQ